MKTMLQIVQAAASELGIPKPSVVAGSTASDAIQLLALLNGVGGELQQEYEWQKLSVEYLFNTQFLSTTGTTTAGSAVITAIADTTGLDTTYAVTGTGINQDSYISSVDSATQVTMTQAATASGTVAIVFCKAKYAFPADYDRPVDNTQWDKTQHWQNIGPQTAQQWAWLKSGYIATGPRVRFRPLGGLFQIWPSLSETHLMGFEYISNYWARSAAGVAKAEFTVDTDTCVFNDRLMIVGLKRAYQTAKGLGSDYDDEYARLLDIAKANDSGSETLSMGPKLQSILISESNIPDSGMGNYAP